MRDRRIIERSHDLPDRRQGAAITWRRPDYDLTGLPIMSILDDLIAQQAESRHRRRLIVRDTVAAIVAFALLLLPFVAWVLG